MLVADDQAGDAGREAGGGFQEGEVVAVSDQPGAEAGGVAGFDGGGCEDFAEGGGRRIVVAAGEGDGAIGGQLVEEGAGVGDGFGGGCGVVEEVAGDDYALRGAGEEGGPWGENCGGVVGHEDAGGAELDFEAEVKIGEDGGARGGVPEEAMGCGMQAAGQGQVSVGQVHGASFWRGVWVGRYKHLTRTGVEVAALRSTARVYRGRGRGS